jgi:hypothetical protein
MSHRRAPPVHVPASVSAVAASTQSACCDDPVAPFDGADDEAVHANIPPPTSAIPTPSAIRITSS